MELGLVTLVVDDYDDAIRFFVDAVGFDLVEDDPIDGVKRWVVVAPSGDRGQRGAGLLLARAGDDTQRRRVGDQTGGRVAFFLHTDDFDGDHARMQEAGVQFVEEPRREPYGSVAVFVDCCGNRWDLLERR